MPGRHLILASASPARRRLLDQIAVQPTVVISGIDEDSFDECRPAPLALTLACAKARTVADTMAGPPGGPGDLILGCDSVLEFDGAALGKPVDPAEAVRRWQAMRGREAVLHTGHCLIELVNAPRSTCREVAEVASTVVRFGSPTDEEIDDYVATGEPLLVAGAFTLDGRSAPFVDGVVGDPSNVIGLSLPLLRRLLRDLGVSLAEIQEPAQRLQQ